MGDVNSYLNNLWYNYNLGESYKRLREPYKLPTRFTEASINRTISQKFNPDPSLSLTESKESIFEPKQLHSSIDMEEMKQNMFDRAIQTRNSDLLQSSLISDSELKEKFTSQITPLSPKKRTIDKGKVGSLIGGVADLAGSFLPEKDEYSGDYGDLASTLDSAYDRASDAVMQMGPVGALVGGIMKGSAVLGKGMNALGAGTDGQTALDAVLGSSFLNMTPIGLINGFFGKNTRDFEKDVASFDTIGSAYTGTENTVDEALEKANKKYGLFSSRARRAANRDINSASSQQDLIRMIADNTQDYFDITNSMAAINNNRYALDLQGGYDQSAVRIGKSGLKVDSIKRAKTIMSKYRKQQTNQLQEGGAIDSFQPYAEFLSKEQGDSTNFRQTRKRDIFRQEKDGWYKNPKTSVINLVEPIKEFKNGGLFGESVIELTQETAINLVQEFQEGGQLPTKTRTLPELIDYAKQVNPRFIQRLSEPSKGIEFIDDNGVKTKGSHYLEWSTDDENNAIIYPRIQEVDGELQFFNSQDAYKRALETKNYLVMTPDEADIFFANDGEHGIAYKSGWPEFFEKFQKGGSINIIPEGALHARKHNMDLDGITKKGIPVIDNNGEQQAEIEKGEIIYRLEVTQELERLCKIYYDENSSNKEKDEVALKAGKLLVYETLYNTQDNTNSLL